MDGQNCHTTLQKLAGHDGDWEVQVEWTGFAAHAYNVVSATCMALLLV